MRLSLLLKWLIVVLKKANFISTHAIKPPFSWTWKFSWRLDPSLWLSWLQEYQVWVVHTNSLNPPDSKKTILESGFRERIHWFRVDGRLICRESLRFEKYPDSYRRGQNCYKKWRLTQFLFSYSNILVIFLILGTVKIEKGWIHGKQNKGTIWHQIHIKNIFRIVQIKFRGNILCSKKRTWRLALSMKHIPSKPGQD